MSEVTELKREIHKELETWHGVEGGIDEDGINKIMSLIDQLDKPETLSQAWIDQNHFETENLLEDLYISDGEAIDYTPHIKVIAVQDLQKQNLIEPKQELPTIPKFVAEFLIGKEDYMLYELLDDEWLYKEHDRVAKWLYDNDELTNRQREIDLVMARDRGYTVEKEQKYVVKIPTNENNDIPYAIVADSGDIWIDALPSKYKLTEEEIRGLTKGDVLFEHFAVKVEVWDE